jgi:hypothetical protein
MERGQRSKSESAHQNKSIESCPQRAGKKPGSYMELRPESAMYLLELLQIARMPEGAYSAISRLRHGSKGNNMRLVWTQILGSLERGNMVSLARI